ncbi:MAG: response regulator transcription factor [Opitutae bacterium]|nr:response regulator transcription factor [Opitutae bacterium]
METQANLLKVLLVDDEAYFRLFVGKVIRLAVNCAVDEARDGAEAIAYCETHDPDLIVLDINMPRVDGVQALGKLRQMKPDTPIIMLTSISEEAIVEECVAKGASYFIRKDVRAEELQAELQEMLKIFPQV